jgi:hypothetical protein
MGKINVGRVIMGGLVAGLVINIVEFLTNAVLFKQEWHDAGVALGKSGDITTKQIAAFNVYGFAVGILMVLTYAAIRSRFGASAQTAMGAGVLVWMLNMALPNAFNSFLHLYPLSLLLSVTGIELVMSAIAGVAGAYFYKEDGAPQSMTAKV